TTLPSSAVRILDVRGKIWTSPNTLLGLLAGAIGLAFGARLRFQHNALVFCRYPFGRGGALVLGNVILVTESSLDVMVTSYRTRCNPPPVECRSTCDDVHLGKHEEAHTYQYQVLGPAFLLVYWIAGIGRQVSALELAADR